MIPNEFLAEFFSLHGCHLVEALSVRGRKIQLPNVSRTDQHLRDVPRLIECLSVQCLVALNDTREVYQLRPFLKQIKGYVSVTVCAYKCV